MTEIIFDGGPFDGTVQVLPDGTMTNVMYLPYQGLYIRYEEANFDDRGRVIMRPTSDLVPMTDLLPSKETLALRTTHVRIVGHDLYGALIVLLDAGQQVLDSLQVGYFHPEIKTMEEVLSVAPDVLSQGAGLRLTSEWSNEQGPWTASVEPI